MTEPTDSLFIGRHVGEDRRAQINVDDEYVSNVHAQVTRSADGTITVEDWGSTNGTYVNDVRIYSARRLSPGDTLRVGRTAVTLPEYLWRTASPSAPSSAEH